MKQPAALSFSDWYVATYLRHKMPDSKIRLRWVPRFWQVLHCWLARWPGRRCVAMGFFFWNARAARVTWDACSSLNSSPSCDSWRSDCTFCLNGAPELSQRDALLGQRQAYNARPWCIWHTCCIFDYSDSSWHSIWKAFGRVQIPWLSWAYCRIVCVGVGTRSI